MGEVRGSDMEVGYSVGAAFAVLYCGYRKFPTFVTTCT